MARYFLTRVRIEGFRGINNASQPLDIKFHDGKLNSVFATNGLCKSSLFEALSYAIFGDVPKLAELHAAESAHDYYCNRFHPSQTASISLTLAPDDGTPPIEIRVQRSSNGVRSVDSPTGHSDPESLLASLRSDLVLLDQRTFAKFLADSPLDRGRSFSSLLGLAKLSEYRQLLETISRTQTLKSDFQIDQLETSIAGLATSAASSEATAAAAYRELVGDEPPMPFDEQSIVTATTQALAQVALLEPFFASANILHADFASIRTAIKKEEGGEKREELAAVLRHQTELEGLSPTTDEETAQATLLDLIREREEALAETRGADFLTMLTAVRRVLVSDDWPDPTACPACDSSLQGSLMDRIDAQLASYDRANELLERVRAAWNSDAWIARLRKLEQSGALALPDTEKTLESLDAHFRTGSPEVSRFNAAIDCHSRLEAKRLARTDELRARRSELETALPPSLVALTEQVEHGHRIQEALSSRAATSAALNEKKQRLAMARRWESFVKTACETFSQAEVALSTAKTNAIETQYREMYEAITQNPEVVPMLLKDDRSQGLLLRLKRFYGLQDLSAATLLQESYRNALAISIFLSTALNHKGASRFIVLDDVTSSFDAGHQWYLMELLRTKISRPLNDKGPQVIVLSHDGLLEKYFDRMASEAQIHHQRLQGAPPSGFVFAQTQDGDRLRQGAEAALQAGQVDKAFPLVRQYLELVLLDVIRSVDIRVPLDFSIRDDRKMAQNCMDAITAMVNTHERSGDLVMEQQQRDDLRNVVVPSLIANWVSHYATASSASLTAHVLLGVLDTVDDFASCFKYTCTCSGPPRSRFYKTLTAKRCAC